MHGQKVLIVEDENIVALDLKLRLEKLGYDVVGTAATAEKALRLFNTQQPNVVLMDIHIRGDTDGIETANQIKQHADIPVIFLTAYADDDTLSRAGKTHPYGYLLKPFSELELHTSIQVALERHCADVRLRKSEIHMRLALEAARLMTWETDSHRDEVIMGYTPNGELVPIRDWLELIGNAMPKDRIQINQALTRLRRVAGAEMLQEFEYQPESGSTRWFTLIGKSFNSAPTQELRVVGIIQDITEKRQIQEQLKQAAMAFRSSADAIVVLDRQRRVISVNEAFSRITGFETDRVSQQELALLSEQELGSSNYQALWREVTEHGIWQGEYTCHNSKNQLIHIRINIGTVQDVSDPIGKYVLVISDLTSMREVQEQLSRASQFDPITDLPNRSMLMARLDQALMHAKHGNRQIGLICLDLDHFKRINDTMGHRTGDSLLRIVAERLSHALGATATLYRVGGDEFIVLIESVRSVQQLQLLAQKMLDRLQQPLELLGTEVVPSASMGIALSPQHSQNRDDLIKMADAAMFAAKNLGRNRFALYQPAMTIDTRNFLDLEQALRKALKKEEFILHYQPQYSVDDGHLTGLEALLRWQHPVRGLISAAEIIPIAESSKLIVELGGWVFEQACRQLRLWLDAGVDPVRLAVNVSVRQLQDLHFVNVIERTLTHFQVPAQHLEIEVTESCLQDNEICLKNLRKIEQMGLAIAIDDFGTGFSCLSSLKKLPIHYLKIDRSFVIDLPKDENDAAIATAIIALGHQMNLKIIAEGIETQAQADFLRVAGCDHFQGYLFGRPMPATEALQLMRKRQPDDPNSHSGRG
ncbi:EAL domain-containing protein [Simiduia curdlanivorans]|uniref:EAL domain-containing protein n=1 Tax=Simiduia curdlanivorans TaxID=1492769 RepID=A0ABV8V0Z5_9GAMM|nr:EAL domain-containing protein [Simiduia curdlanivorans]MDN3637639.1 EAL domain-containing protein [Simiduia curdlanivorans]